MSHPFCHKCERCHLPPCKFEVGGLWHRQQYSSRLNTSPAESVISDDIQLSRLVRAPYEDEYRDLVPGMLRQEQKPLEPPSEQGTEPETAAAAAAKPKSETEPEPEPESDSDSDSEAEAEAEPKSKSKSEPEPEPAPELEPELEQAGAAAAARAGTAPAAEQKSSCVSGQFLHLVVFPSGFLIISFGLFVYSYFL